MILNGHILIPARHSYCLRVDTVHDNSGLGSDEYPIYLSCTRYDIDNDRQPVFSNGHRLFILCVREITDTVYRAENVPWDPTPEYYIKFNPREGQLELF